MPYLPENGTLMEVKAVPYYGDFLLICTFRCPDTDTTDAPHACGIDLGVDNTAALVSSSGHCVLYKGGAAKAMNQWYNKKIPALCSHDWAFPKRSCKARAAPHKTDGCPVQEKGPVPEGLPS